MQDRYRRMKDTLRTRRTKKKERDTKQYIYIDMCYELYMYMFLSRLQLN